MSIIKSERRRFLRMPSSIFISGKKTLQIIIIIIIITTNISTDEKILHNEYTSADNITILDGKFLYIA